MAASATSRKPPVVVVRDADDDFASLLDEALDATPKAAEASAPSPPPGPGAGSLGLLPPQILHNILRRLSASDICAMTCTCHAMRIASEDEEIWCALVSHRWGHKQNGGQDAAAAAAEAAEALDFEELDDDVERTPASASSSAKRRRLSDAGTSSHHPSGSGSANVKMKSSRWRNLYKHRDAKDCASVTDSFSGLPPEIIEQTKDLVAAWRSDCPVPPAASGCTKRPGAGAGAQDAGAGAGGVPGGTLKERILRWRREHGFINVVDERGAHTCTPSCKFVAMHTRPGDAVSFLCTSTGKLHLCGESRCDALVFDETSHEMICPLTGFCTPLIFRRGGADDDAEEEVEFL